jgi:hypothetical protein
MISALLPSRHRSDLLIRSVASLYDTADKPGGVEVLICGDPDDPGTGDTALDLWRQFPGVRYLMTYERFGYAQFERYYNFMANSASGDWMMLWNDDAVMRTQGWDTVVESMPVGTLSLQTNQAPHNIFPVVHKLLIQAMGHFSLSRHCDTWVTDVASGAGVYHPTAVEAFHDRADLTGNNHDDIFRETSGNYATHDYYGEEMSRLRGEDVERVRKALDEWGGRS